MLELTTLIGSGRERDVYLYPGRADRVVKIMKPEAGVDRNSVEEWFLARARRPRGLVAVPALHGWVESNRGRGLVYQRIREDWGTTCRSLTQCLTEGALEAERSQALFELAIASLRDEGFLVYDPTPDNILMRATPGPDGRQLVLVDGFGPNTITTRAFFRTLFPALARRKIDRVRARARVDWYAS
jgi:hypothetical protein